MNRHKLKFFSAALILLLLNISCSEKREIFIEDDFGVAPVLVVEAGETIELKSGTHTYSRVVVLGTLVVQDAVNTDGVFNANEAGALELVANEVIVGEDGVIEGAKYHDGASAFIPPAAEESDICFGNGCSNGSIRIDSTSISIAGQIVTDGSFVLEGTELGHYRAGRIELVAATIEVSGSLITTGADGVGGPDGDNPSSHGSSGGQILINASDSLSISGSLITAGGNGHDGSCDDTLGLESGGTNGGHGGDITIDPEYELPDLTFDVAGGQAGVTIIGDCIDPSDGQDGTVVGIL